MNFIFLRVMKYECNGFCAKLTWRPLGVIYFARAPLRSYFHDPQKNEIYFLNKYKHFYLCINFFLNYNMKK